MATGSIDGYRLGSMPRRVLHERLRATWPDEQGFAAMLALLDGWADLLNKLGEKALRAAVQDFRRCVEQERQHHAAQIKHEQKSRLREMLLRMGDDPGPLPPLPENAGGQDSYAMVHALLEKAEATNLRAKLAGDQAALFDLGELVARCRWDSADDNATTAIWTIAKQLGCEEWVSGRPAGSPTGQRESIHRLVLNRLPEMDELFSTRPLPHRPQGLSGTEPHAIIQVDAKLAQIQGGITQLHRQNEVLGCDVLRIAESVECIADDSENAPAGQEALTVRQCAERAKTTIPMIKRAIKQGELRAKPLRTRGTGTEYRIMQKDFEQWLASPGSDKAAEVAQIPTKSKGNRPPLPNFLDR